MDAPCTELIPARFQLPVASVERVLCAYAREHAVPNNVDVPHD